MTKQIDRRFNKDLSTPDPIPQVGIERVQKLMESGRIHRYGEANEDELDVLMLERDYANYMDTRYCTALNSCGCGLFVALKCVGVQPGDAVLTNAFTLAPVPGAIAHFPHRSSRPASQSGEFWGKGAAAFPHAGPHRRYG